MLSKNELYFNINIQRKDVFIRLYLCIYLDDLERSKIKKIILVNGRNKKKNDFLNRFNGATNYILSY